MKNIDSIINELDIKHIAKIDNFLNDKDFSDLKENVENIIKQKGNKYFRKTKDGKQIQFQDAEYEEID